MTDTPISPGRYVRDASAFQGIIVAELAERLEWSPEEIVALLDGELSLTEEIARQLSAVLGKSPETWLRLEASYRSNLARGAAS